MASARDSRTVAIRKLPESLTTLASDGLSPTTQSFGPIASNRGLQRSIEAFGPAKDGGRDELLASFAVFGGEFVTQCHADGAARNVNGASGQRCEDAFFTENLRFDRRVVSEHGDHGLATTCFRGSVRDVRAIRAQRLGAAAGTVVDHHAMSGSKQALCYTRTHVA